MAFGFRSSKVRDADAESREHSGGWYADPYGTAARRWYDNVTGWTDRVQGEGQAPDKTGLERLDEAAVAGEAPPRLVDEDGKPLPLSRPVDPKYMSDARPVR
ncbi:MAG TPA: hypothetical protein VG410_05305 [Solirubrobacteraceae bacterium]|jgi:hypothetical protein|nr:hypothetical protein [Solirubrobacteraceae bacterium]